MKNYTGLLFLIFIAILISCKAKRAERMKGDQIPNEVEYSILNLCGTDALGRRIETCSSTGKQTPYVGLFYSLWLGQHNQGIYDISKLLRDNPSALFNPDGEPESPLEQFHFWGEPLYGYYNMNDPWVVTRHVELLTNATIDYLCLDATNTFIYPNPAKNLFEVLLKFQEQGFSVPKIVFYTNSRSGETVNRIYESFYKDGTYERLWFKPNGKPLIIGITEENASASDMTKYHSFTDYIVPEMREYFDVRESQWPNGDYNPGAIPWMSWQCPQWNHNGSVAVPVAQHSHSVIYASSMHPECSRGYNNTTRPVEKEWVAGANFQTMWDAVHKRKDSINNVLITSFNEWMAIKYKDEADKVFFVDVYTPEFSRDIEMMKGGYNDNFYMQLVENIRRFKFTEDSHHNVQATYVDFAGDAISRDFVNAASTGKYTDNSNRNDITKINVSHDGKKIYFIIQTLDDITRHNGEELNWMNVLIKTRTEGPSFEGYQFVINRKPGKPNKTSVERSTGGYRWEYAGDADYSIEKNVLQLAIPLALLEVPENNYSIEFKVADNVTGFGNLMDYYVTGDSAPLGRLNFSYGY